MKRNPLFQVLIMSIWGGTVFAVAVVAFVSLLMNSGIPNYSFAAAANLSIFAIAFSMDRIIRAIEGFPLR